MSIDSTTVYVMIIIFLSTVVRATFGFGEALIAMPLLAMIIDIKIATPLMAMVGTSIALVILLKSWRKVDLPDAKRLILSSILGIPLGIFLLKDGYSILIKIMLAFIIISFSAYKLLQPEISGMIGKRSSYVFGFFAGVLGGGLQHERSSSGYLWHFKTLASAQISSHAARILHTNRLFHTHWPLGFRSLDVNCFPALCLFYPNSCAGYSAGIPTEPVGICAEI